MISNPIVILKGCHDMPWLFKLTTLLHCLCAPATHCCCHVFDTHGGSAKRFILLWQLTKKWLSSYPVYWRNANSQNYFWPNGLWQIGNIWSTTERNKNTTIGCVVPAWSTRGNPKLCRGKPKLCRGKSKLCRGPTNPKISQNHVRSENVGLNLWKTFKNMMFGSVTICWTIFGVTLWCP